mmetsp:Transcript_23871/g.35021  ORF Transcript_23871/g.35021 Transcript_23871/m.35021 type:complete len:876 (+) Transcript_23871:38-2665(+)
MEEPVEIHRLAELTHELEQELDTAMMKVSEDMSMEYTVETSDSDDNDGLSDDEMMLYQSTSVLLEELSSLSIESLVSSPHCKPSPAERVAEPSSFGGSLNTMSVQESLPTSTPVLPVDGHILGDYSDWSLLPVDEGDKAQDILSSYFGLRPALSGLGSHSLVGHTASIVHILEVILRPDTPLKVIIAGVAKVASVERLRFEEVSHPDDDEEVGETTRGQVKRVRPHGTDGCSGHAVVRCRQQKPARRVEAADEPTGWDAIDVQVCLSRALKQRVLVCQFVRLTPVPLRRGAAPTSTPNSNTSKGKHKVFTATTSPPSLLHSAAALPLTRFSPVATEAPPPAHIISVFQRVFTRYLLSLSCLYSLKGSAVTIPLDPHYISLVEGLLRDLMWASIRKGADEMQAHIAGVEERCEAMKTTLASIYKQHGVPLPSKGDPLPTHPSLSTDIPPPDVEVFASVSNVQLKDSHIQTPSPQLLSNDIGMEPPLFHDDSDIEATSSMGDSDGIDIDGEVDIDAAITSGRRGQKDFEFIGGGIGRCLLEMEDISNMYQKRCDEELTDRLSCRNEVTVETVQNICNRRRALLVHLLHSPQAKASALSRSFHTTFAGVLPVGTMGTAISRHSDKQQESVVSSSSSPRATNDSGAGGQGSWFSGWFGGKKASVSGVSTPPESSKGESAAIEELPSQDSTINKTEVKTKDLIAEVNLNSPALSEEIVLYYCACLVCYSPADVVGMPGFLYLTGNWIGVASRGVMGGTRRRELYPLKDLESASLCGPAKGAEADKTETPTKNAPSREAVASPSTTHTPGRSVLSTLQQSLGMSYLSTGCKLIFQVKSLPETECTENTIEIRFTPALVDADKVRAILLEARDMLKNIPPGP